MDSSAAQIFYDNLFSSVKKRGRPTVADVTVLCNQLENWAMFSPEQSQQIKMSAVQTVQYLMDFDEVKGNDCMLKAYQIVGRFSGNMGMHGVFDQLEKQGNFRQSFKFHCLWGQSHAEKKHTQKFREIFEMCCRRVKSVSETDIKVAFKDIADNLLEGHFLAGEEFAAVPVTTKNRRRRSSLAVLHQQATKNFQPITSNVKSKMVLKVELIDRIADDYLPVSPEELKAAALQDYCNETVDMEISLIPEQNKCDDDDMDITTTEGDPILQTEGTQLHSMAPPLHCKSKAPLTPLQEVSDREVSDGKRRRIYSPAKPVSESRLTFKRDSAPSAVSFSENEYQKAEAIFSDTVNFDHQGQPLAIDNTIPVQEVPNMTIKVYEDPEYSVMQPSAHPPTVRQPFSVIEPKIASSKPQEDIKTKNTVSEERGKESAIKIEDENKKPHETFRVPLHQKPFEERKPLRPSLGTDAVQKEVDSPGYNFDDEPTLAGGKFSRFGFEKPHAGIVTSTPAHGNNNPTAETFFKDDVFTSPLKDDEDEETFVSGGFMTKSLQRRQSLGKSLAPVRQERTESQDMTLTTALSKVTVGSPHEALDRTGVEDVRPCIDIPTGNVNPWEKSIRQRIMTQFDTPTHQHEFRNIAPKVQRNKEIDLGGYKLHVLDLIGEGGFAKVFKCIDDDEQILALKYEVPPCAWEVYICDQIHKRLLRGKHYEITNNVMTISDAFIYSNASILLNEYHGLGTLLDLSSSLHGSPPSQLVVFLAIQIASILKEIHSCGIIHADVKPDNIMVLSGVDENGSPDELLSKKVVKFIDWGRAIDMTMMPVKDFVGRGGTANFDCPEMLKKQPWNYHTDFFGFVATVHVIIFGKYSKVLVDGSRNSMDQSIRRRLPCRDVMEGVFDKLLNIPSCKELPSWDDVIDTMTVFFKDNFDPVEWRTAARAFNSATTNK